MPTNPILRTVSGHEVRPAVFGAMQCGGNADEAQSRAMLERCRDEGIVHLDTAYAYTDGESEKIVGRFAAPIRDELFVATKVGLTGGAGRKNLTAQFDRSRARLGADQVDLLYLHRFDPETPLEETAEFFASAKQRGLIRYVGLSNFAAWQVMKMIAVAQRLDFTIDVIQPMFSLVKRQAEVELLPMCIGEGVLACTYSPLGGGLLTGKYAAKESGRLLSEPKYAQRYAPQWMHDAASGLKAIADREGVHPATLAVAWVMHHRYRPAPIVSGRSIEQLEPSLAGLSFEMTPELNAELSDLTPTPPPATDRLEEG
ncbi:oxidoreductase, aldo/keto reductase family protein [Fulvimarina pelagi HTCC2506]|uniref:Oxidoreductase, aldo/keto reductase family protein n=1 Tax=Fulvimarina pelagi HTCC2506 TaxID=314231 RepID=Q0G0V1_9HYPH|nr:aldo/keto reductase [Fulvimarina pelagi]EAU40888.1 oxidoreductase, aldo/keto reductase family protein [Fulvimarina pelagi HTCC2506]